MSFAKKYSGTRPTILGWDQLQRKIACVYYQWSGTTRGGDGQSWTIPCLLPKNILGQDQLQENLAYVYCQWSRTTRAGDRQS